MVITWPCDLLRVTSDLLHIEHFDRSAGVGLSMGEQILTAGQERWTLSISTGPEWRETQIKLFETLVDRMRGRVNIADLCIVRAYAYDATVSPAQQPWADGAWFSDGTGFAVPGVQPLATTAAALAGATQIQVGLTEPKRPPLRNGDLFSWGGWLHRAHTATSGGAVQFEPPLRADMPAGTVIETTRPRVRMRFASKDEGRRARDLLSWGEPVTLNFVEAFDR